MSNHPAPALGRAPKAAELDRRLLDAAVSRDAAAVQAIGREYAETMTNYELANALCRLAMAAGAFAHLVPAGTRAGVISELANAEALLALAGVKRR